MVRLLLAFVFSVMLLDAAMAQIPMSPQQRMDYWSAIEGKILSARSALQRQADDASDPLWVVDDRGVVQVTDGAFLRERIVALATVNQMIGVESALIGTLPLWAQAGALAVGEEGRVEILADKVMANYRAKSDKTRRTAMADFERMLERARAEFFKAKKERDGGAGSVLAVAGRCGEPEPADSVRYRWTTYGAQGGYSIYWQNGDVLCGTYYYTAAIINGDEIETAKCSDPGRTDCTKGSQIYKIDWASSEGRDMIVTSDPSSTLARCRPAHKSTQAC